MYQHAMRALANLSPGVGVLLHSLERTVNFQRELIPEIRPLFVVVRDRSEPFLACLRKEGDLHDPRKSRFISS